MSNASRRNKALARATAAQTKIQEAETNQILFKNGSSVSFGKPSPDVVRSDVLRGTRSLEGAISIQPAVAQSPLATGSLQFDSSGGLPTFETLALARERSAAAMTLQQIPSQASTAGLQVNSAAPGAPTEDQIRNGVGLHFFLDINRRIIACDLAAVQFMAETLDFSETLEVCTELFMSSGARVIIPLSILELLNAFSQKSNSRIPLHSDLHPYMVAREQLIKKMTAAVVKAPPQSDESLRRKLDGQSVTPVPAMLHQGVPSLEVLTAREAVADLSLTRHAISQNLFTQSAKDVESRAVAKQLATQSDHHGDSAKIIPDVNLELDESAEAQAESTRAFAESVLKTQGVEANLPPCTKTAPSITAAPATAASPFMPVPAWMNQIVEDATPLPLSSLVSLDSHAAFATPLLPHEPGFAGASDAIITDNDILEGSLGEQHANANNPVTNPVTNSAGIPTTVPESAAADVHAQAVSPPDSPSVPARPNVSRYGIGVTPGTEQPTPNRRVVKRQLELQRQRAATGSNNQPVQLSEASDAGVDQASGAGVREAGAGAPSAAGSPPTQPAPSGPQPSPRAQYGTIHPNDRVSITPY